MSESAQAFVRMEELGKRYGKGSLVLDGLSFEAVAGDFVSVVGQSGCGKSTLLKLLAGMVEPSAGNVFIDGKPPHEKREELSFIFQDSTLLPWLNVRRNIELPLKLRGVGKTERQTVAERLLELVGLEHIGGRYPRQLSGGMKMRVSLARGLATEPRLLLMDEPFGALDAITRNRLNEELLALRESSPFTTFFVTHSVGEAVFLSNKVIILSVNPGRIHACIDVDLPYPRTADTREDPAFQKLVAAVNHELHKVEH